MRQYKKPIVWIMIVGVVFCIVLAFGFLTNPKEEKSENENWWVPELSVNEYAKVWKEGSYPSLIMYNNTLYAAAEMPEGEIVHERKGTIKTKVEQGVPTQNFETNDDLVGCTIHAWSGNYIYVLRGDEYFAYKDVTADDDLFMYMNVADGSREDENKTKAFVQNKYLLALADTEHNYLQYYGGTEVGAANTTIVYLTEINDEIVAFYDEIIRTTNEIVYKKCEISMQERNAAYEYISTFLMNYVPTEDTELNDLVEAIVSSSGGYGNQGISIRIIGCTKEKIDLFREKICNYEYLEFPNSDPWEATVIVDEETPDWGITLSVKNVTSTGATLVCEQSGGTAEGSLITGTDFVVHKYIDNGWIEAGDTRNMVWTSMGLGIIRDGTCEWTVNWKNMYGKLPEGRYRIGKEISDNKGDAMFYGEFIVYAEEPIITVEAELASDRNHPFYTKSLSASATNSAPVHKIENLDELENFKFYYADSLQVDEDVNVPSFEEATKHMDEAYFEKYTLLAIYLRSNSSSWEYGVTNIEKSGFVLKFYIGQTNHPQTLAEGYVGRMMLVPIAKSMLEGVRSYRAYYDNKYYYHDEILEVTERTIHFGEVTTKNLFYPYRELHVGDKITVVYDGSMKMTSPGQFGEVYELFFVNEYGNTVSAFPKEK